MLTVVVVYSFNKHRQTQCMQQEIKHMKFQSLDIINNWTSVCIINKSTTDSS